MGIKAKELLGTLSPVYGMATGNGLFGNAVGLLPALAKDMRNDRKKKKDGSDMSAAEEAAMPAMKKGGSVKSKKHRGDGICKKGHTKGKMI